MSDPYVSGIWHVKAGSEDEFVSRWTEFTTWSKENASGARGFVLLRDLKDRGHFQSIGTWDDRQSIDAWRERPEFAKLFARCRELCDGFTGLDFELVASPAPVA